MRPALLNAVLALVLLAALGTGIWLRTSQLDLRPMHTDEAVQADRLGSLMRGEGFTYNPSDGHGPGLLYLSLPIAWASGVKDYPDLNERILRLVPALSGIALLLAAALFWKPLGGIGVAITATLTALSPMHVYYSRYYIMEMPLVLLLALSLFCLWRYLDKPSLAWAIAAGVCVALMHVTKETFAISMLALVGAIVTVIASGHRRGEPYPLPSARSLIAHAGWAAAVTLLLSAALYSHFFTNLPAIADSYTTYLNYLGRSAGAGGHEKPPGYYLGLLWWKKTELFTWSEALVLTLATVGGIAAFVSSGYTAKQRVFLRILALYALLTLLIYSIIPYKTPWSILAFLHAAVLLAGAGFAFLFKYTPTAPVHRVWIRLLASLPPGSSGQLPLPGQRRPQPVCLFSHDHQISIQTGGRGRWRAARDPPRPHRSSVPPGIGMAIALVLPQYC